MRHNDQKWLGTWLACTGGTIAVLCWKPFQILLNTLRCLHFDFIVRCSTTSFLHLSKRYCHPLVRPAHLQRCPGQLGNFRWLNVPNLGAKMMQTPIPRPDLLTSPTQVVLNDLLQKSTAFDIHHHSSKKKIKSIIHHHSPSSFTIHPTISNTCVWTSGHQCLLSARHLSSPWKRPLVAELGAPKALLGADQTWKWSTVWTHKRTGWVRTTQCASILLLYNQYYIKWL